MGSRVLLALLVSVENTPLGENHRQNGVPPVVGDSFVNFVSKDHADALLLQLLCAEQGDNAVIVAASLTEAVPVSIKGESGDEAHIGIHECL